MPRRQLSAWLRWEVPGHPGGIAPQEQAVNWTEARTRLVRRVSRLPSAPPLIICKILKYIDLYGSVGIRYRSEYHFGIRGSARPHR